MLDYWLAITHIESEEILLAIPTNNFSWLDKSYRKKFSDDINKNTRSIVDRSDGNVLSSDEAAEKILQIIGTVNG